MSTVECNNEKTYKFKEDLTILLIPIVLNQIFYYLNIHWKNT